MFDINQSENSSLQNLNGSIEIYEKLLTVERKLREQTPLQEENLHGEADQASRFVRKLIRRQELIVQGLQKEVLKLMIDKPKILDQDNQLEEK